MNLKSAAFLALVAMILVTIMGLYDAVSVIMAVMQGLVPAVQLLSSLIYAFASVAVTIFFFSSYKQS